MRRARLFGLMVLCCVLVSGCTGSVTRPTAAFVVCPLGSEGRLDYVFTSTSTTIPDHWIREMVWDFDDGTPPVAAWGDVLHRFAEPGSYHVNLVITDSRGISGTVMMPVDVQTAAFIHPTWRLTLGYPPTVSGIVENRHDETLRRVVVRAKFYDADGVRRTDGRFELSDLEPGEKAAFAIKAEEFMSFIVNATVDIESFDADCPALPVKH